jgi:hypothetical protein
MDSVLDAVLKGVGLGYVFESQIKGISGQSRIVRVLEDCPMISLARARITVAGRRAAAA